MTDLPYQCPLTWYLLWATYRVQVNRTQRHKILLYWDLVD